ncbi:MAG: MFS transporter, partial [Dehalococcoidales bacterium]|nr:MFS transporter [Dehalococcoidales bacterium]
MAERAGAAANKSIVLIISTTAAFILPFLVASVNIALPKMGQEFHMEAVVMSWVSTAYFLAVAVFQVPVGRLSDIFGRRRFFLIGLVISTIASFLGAFAPATAVLIVSRVLQGIGAGMSFNNSVAILTSVFPPEERAKALGISQAGTYLGLSLGPLIGGVMTEHFGWRSLFFLSACLGVFLVGLVFIGLRAEWRQAAGEKFDSLGAVVYVFAIALFMYGFSSLPGAIGAIFFVLGILGLVFFGYWESRQPSPIFELSLFQRNRTFLLSNLAALITYISTFAVNFLLSLYLQYIKAFSAQSAGMVLVVA